MSRYTGSERIFMLTLATGGHLVSWSVVLCLLLWLVRPEMGRDWIVTRGCTFGAIIAGVICVPLWCLMFLSMLSNWNDRRRQAYIDKKLRELDLEDDDAS
jgi:hypothetical protein